MKNSATGHKVSGEYVYLSQLAVQPTTYLTTHSINVLQTIELN